MKNKIEGNEVFTGFDGHTYQGRQFVKNGIFYSEYCDPEKRWKSTIN